MADRPLVLQTEPLDPEAVRWLGERAEVRFCSADDPRFENLLRQADALIVRTYTLVTDAMLAHATRLRVVGRAGVGLDNIDTAACERRGIAIVHTPDANTQAVVEYVVCLLGDALRPRAVLEEAVDADIWNRLRAEVKARHQMDELTLGIVGLGRIGRRVAAVASAIGFRVVYNDLVDVPLGERSGAASVRFDELIASSDAITLHVDGRASNRHLIGGAALGKMKRDVVLINTSRGHVVDAGVLAEFLRANPGAMALLDVHEPEPFGPDYPLLGLRNAHLLPHLASRTDKAMKAMSWVVKDVARVLGV